MQNSSAPADTSDIKIDAALPVAERMERYCAQGGNPYCFRCGDGTVTVEFVENGKPLDRLLVEYFSNLPPDCGKEPQP